MLSKFEIHVRLDDLEKATINRVDGVRIPNNRLRDDNFAAILKNCSEYKIILELTHPDEYELKMGNRVFFTRYSDEITDFKKCFQDVEVGVMAYSLADCKNLEIAGVDYIQFDLSENNVTNSIGRITDLKSLIPHKTEYGWDLLTLNTPVIVGNISNVEDFKSLFDQADIKGLVVDDWNQDTHDLIIQIRQLMGHA